MRYNGLSHVNFEVEEENNMYKLDIYEIVTKEVDGFTVADESAEWNLVETIKGATEADCLDQANEKYDQENYHWTNPYKA